MAGWATRAAAPTAAPFKNPRRPTEDFFFAMGLSYGGGGGCQGKRPLLSRLKKAHQSAAAVFTFSGCGKEETMKYLLIGLVIIATVALRLAINDWTAGLILVAAGSAVVRRIAASS